MKKISKILVLFTGGTITMIKNADGVLGPAKDIQQIQKFFPELKEIAEITSLDVCDIDSSDMTPETWQVLAQRIYENYQNYDGFVITHGTDTLAYTASALSFALPNLNKPVILTGAQKPISDLGSDSPFNIFNSFKVAVSGAIREVAIVFDTKIMRGNRCSKRHAKKIDAFWSPQFPLLGEIGVDIKYFPHHDTHHSHSHSRLKLQDKFDSNIISLNLFPGFMPTIFEKIIEEKIYKGIILRGFGAGNIPTNNTIAPWIKRAIEQKIPVVLISPCPGGTTYLSLYQTGQAALKAGVISAKDMTWEASTVKLMWALAQNSDFEKIRDIMEKNIAGEIS